MFPWQKLLRAGINVGPVKLPHALQEVAGRRRVTAALAREAAGLALELNCEVGHLYDLHDPAQDRGAGDFKDPGVGEQHDHVTARRYDNLRTLLEQPPGALVELLDDVLEMTGFHEAALEVE